MKGHKKIIISKMNKEDFIILNRGTLYVLYQKAINEKNFNALKIIRSALERLRKEEEIQHEFAPFWGVTISLEDIDKLYTQRTSIPEYAYTIPNDYYKKIYQKLTEEEIEDICHSIKKKSCQNCHNSLCYKTKEEKLGIGSRNLSHDSFCEEWVNEVMIGEYHALRMQKNIGVMPK